MNLVLPSTVEDINRLQQNYEMLSKDVLGYNKGFENIFVEKRYKREVSLPDGIKNWDIDNIHSYLNFEDDGGFKAIESAEVVQVVPEEENSRLRCDSYSSMTSSMDDHRNSMFFQGGGSLGVKTINTICVDSGSTCISADPSYPDSIFKTMDPEETYQNLEVFLQQVPEVSENLPSPLSVSSSESSFEMPVLHSNYFLQGCTQDSLSEAPRGTKRPASTSSDVDIFGLRTAKQQCVSPPPALYNEVRRKNNIASKNCRKTRKEKQKEMEVRVSELEKEKEGLRVEVQVLEELIQAHKMQLYAILKKR